MVVFVTATMTVTVTCDVTVTVIFVICLLLVPLPVVATIFLSCNNMPKKWTDNCAHDGECKSHAACRHKERQPRGKVSKKTGSMQNDDDGHNTDWVSLFDEFGFQSQGTNSSHSLSTISSSNESSSSSGTDNSDNTA